MLLALQKVMLATKSDLWSIFYIPEHHSEIPEIMSIPMI